MHYFLFIGPASPFWSGPAGLAPAACPHKSFYQIRYGKEPSAPAVKAPASIVRREKRRLRINPPITAKDPPQNSARLAQVLTKSGEELFLTWTMSASRPSTSKPAPRPKIQPAIHRAADKFSKKLPKCSFHSCRLRVERRRLVCFTPLRCAPHLPPSRPVRLRYPCGGFQQVTGI